MCVSSQKPMTLKSCWTRRVLLDHPRVPAEGFEHAAPSGEAVLEEKSNQE